jgi:hypothetical protein
LALSFSNKILVYDVPLDLEKLLAGEAYLLSVSSLPRST